MNTIFRLFCLLQIIGGFLLLHFGYLVFIDWQDETAIALIGLLCAMIGLLVVITFSILGIRKFR